MRTPSRLAPVFVAAMASLGALGAGCDTSVQTPGTPDAAPANRDLSAHGVSDASMMHMPDAAPDAAMLDMAVPAQAIKNVFIILMENKQWSSIKGDTDAPYINKTLLSLGSYTENYHQPPGNHPSETNYIWLEAGSNLGIADDNPPANNHKATTAHLVTLLDKAGISWKSYQEGIDGTSCPLVDNSKTNYAVRHNPMVFFDDVTNTNDARSQYCIDHVRPYTELAADLASGKVARYNFITPSLCHDMHGNGTGCLIPHVGDGDAWLASEVPAILGSQVYKAGGALFVTWDECEQLEIIKCDDPVGMIVLSPFAKGGGYSNKLLYDHSSTLRTFQEIFGVKPLLGGAATATDLSDLFSTFP